MSPQYRIRTGLFLVFVFAVAMLLRLALILASPFSNTTIDLSIYRDGGQLMSCGINPYDFQDNVPVREKLRTDADAFSEYTCETQERWNYYAAGNLPLSLLFYGAINAISPSPFAYRVAFALTDSLLAVAIGYFILHYWTSVSPRLRYAFALGLGAFFPTLLLWGVLLPEDKGLQILFMLLAILTARAEQPAARMLLSPVFLGAAVAYKGLGVFIAPVCLYYAARLDQRPLFTRATLRSIAVYVSLSLVFTAVWFVPFVPQIFAMMSQRLERASANAGHSSIWRLISWLLPNAWQTVRLAVVAIVLGISGWGLLARRLCLEQFCAVLLVCFIGLWLSSGSMDRMNIAYLTAVLLLGSVSASGFRILAVYYIAAGLVGYTLFTAYRALLGRSGQINIEWVDIPINAGFLCIFLGILILQVVRGASVPALRERD